MSASPRNALVAVGTRLCCPAMVARATECRPSAPITRSASAWLPSAKESHTPAPVSIRLVQRRPSRRESLGTPAASSRCRSARATV